MADRKQFSNLRIGELPRLEFLSIDTLTFHEDPDNGRLLRLVDRLGSEKILKNPPIVANFNGVDKNIILDGANRVTAMLKLGFQHLLVQLVSIENPLLGIQCWHHAVEKFDKEYFIKKLNRLDGVKTESDRDFKLVDNDYYAVNQDPAIMCRMIFRDNSTVIIKSEADLLTRVKLLNEITEWYLGEQLSDRVSYINLDHLKRHYPDFQTLIAFRPYSKGEFRQIIDAGLKMPAGVTRVFLPKRALGLNIPLEFLKSNLTLAEKNRWLEEQILRKVRDKSIRFYSEPTFVFDE